jgi:ABC-2 type transport system permease protein
MSHIANIIKKELRELLTPGSIASVLIMVILFACLGGLIGDEVSKSTVLPTIGIANYEDQVIETEYGDWNAYEVLKTIYINSGDKRITPENVDQFVLKMDKNNVLQQMEATGASVVLVLADDFKKNIEGSMEEYGSDAANKEYKKGVIDQYYLYQPAGMISGSISSATTTSIITLMNTSLSAHLTGPDEMLYIDFLKNPISGTSTHTYINGEPYDDVTPADISNALSSQSMFVPIIIMIIIMMIGSIVISSMGSEKENKTLETLLTLPISRTTIVTGKIIASAIVGLVFGAAYMLGMGMYIGSVSSIGVGTSGIDLSAIGLTLSISDYAILGVSMFLAISCALGICMILGAFAKNYKSAQTMTMPLSILAIIPMFVIMFSGWYGSNIMMKVLLFVIPFSHPMMATEALLNGDLTLVLSGIVYMAAFAAVAILITVRLYKSDILITGLSQNKYIEMFRGAGKHKKS